MAEKHKHGDSEATADERVALTAESRAQMEQFRVAHETKVLTILLSDLEESTKQQAELGNVRAAELVRAHRSVFRAVLQDLDGQEIGTAGDSFLVVFAAPSEGVKFALFMQAATRKAREDEPEFPSPRVGIHQGQVVVERDAPGRRVTEIYGLQVSAAARIMELGRRGQILCSRAVFDDARAILRSDDLPGLCPVAWLRHGPYRFKGIEDSHEVCEVGEEGVAPLEVPPETAKGWPAGEAEEQLGWRPAAGVVVPGTNWVLEERLGKEESEEGRWKYRGEFGEVWKAWNPSDKSQQAFKFCFKRDRVPVLKREARLLKSLQKYRHPNLAEVYDVTEAGRPPYYLEMEYVEGPSLEEWLATDPPLGDRLEVVAQVADALDTVHAAGIYHRDIKPSNILLTYRQDGALQAKLTDFGLGAAEDKELLRSIRVSRVEGVAGTWDYIAPELRAGGQASPQSDLYSLGLTLFQIAAGDLEAPAGPGWERLIGSEILRQDIGKCMDRDPGNRWLRAGELATALRSHDESLQLLRLERERQERLRRARRRKAFTAAIAAAALAVVISTYFGVQAYRSHQAEIEARSREDAERQAKEDEAAAKVEEQRWRSLGEARSLIENGSYGEALGKLKEAASIKHDHVTRLSLWRFATFYTDHPLATLRGHADYVRSFAFSADGKVLASGSWDGTIRFWNLATGKEVRTLTAHKGIVQCLALSPDGETLASGGGVDDPTVKLWDVATGRQRLALSGHTDAVSSVAFSPNGKTLASGSVDKTTKLWEISTGRVLLTFTGHTESVLSVAFSPDGKALASGSFDDTIRLWDVGTGMEIVTIGPLASGAYSVAFSPDGRKLAFPATPHILIWDVAERKVLCSLSGHTTWVRSVAFSPDGKTLASGSRDGTIRLWHVATGEEFFTLGDHTDGDSCVAFSPDGRTLVSGSADHAINLWGVPPARQLRTLTEWPHWVGPVARILTGHTVPVHSVGFSPNGKTLASGGSDNTLKVWELTTGRELHTLSGHAGWWYSVAFSPDGKTLALGEGQQVNLWDVATGQKLRELIGHSVGVRAVAFSPDGKTLASGSFEGTIKLWDLATGGQIATLTGHTQDVRSFAFHPNGKMLASGSSDNTIKLWDVATGQELYTVAGHIDRVVSVAFSPDGAALASGSLDATIKLWDVATGEELRTVKGHGDCVRSVAFSPDGKILASASEDSTIRLWDTAMWTEVVTIGPFGSGAYSVAFSPDGRELACAVGNDVLIYDFHAYDEDIGRWLREAGVAVGLTSQ